MERLSRAETDYFQALSRRAPQPTVNSHRSAIRPFVAFCQERGHSSDNLEIADICEFIASQYATQSKRTLKGYIASLSNFLAFLWTTGPAIIKARIIHYLNRLSTRNGGVPGKIPTLDPRYFESDDPRVAAVETLLTHLRDGRFGTRTHALVELLLATTAPSSAIRYVNVGDLNQSESTVVVQVSEAYAVGEYNLLEERTISLPSCTLEALQTYMKYERIGGEDEEVDSLFTTSNGRISASTVRESIKRASTERLATPTIPSDGEQTTRQSQDGASRVVTPSDIWQYSLRQRVQ